MPLSPRDPLLFQWHFFICLADVYLGRVVGGIERLRKTVEINPNWGLSHFILAGALALAGLRAEAAEFCAVARRLRVSPQFHHRQVPRRSSERQPRVPRAARAFLRGAAFGGSARGGIERISPPNFGEKPAKRSGSSRQRNRWFADSPLERDGFELLVPQHEKPGISGASQAS